MGWLSGPSAGDDRYIIVEANYNNKIIDLNALAGNDTLDLRGENQISGYRSGLFENFSITDSTDDIGQYLLVAGYIGASFVTFKAREFETIKFVDYTYEVVINDITSPLIEVSAETTKLKQGETTKILLTLNEASTDFDISDIDVSGGTLSNFSGSGTSYSVDFTQNLTGITDGIVSIDSNKFSDAAGNFNNDGADANNRVTIQLNGITLQNTSASDVFVGSSGADEVIYAKASSEYSIQVDNSVISVSSGIERDVLQNIERITFTDKKLAFDFSKGEAAYNAATMIGTAFGSDYVNTYFSEGLKIFDNGSTLSQVAELIVNLGLIENMIGSDNSTWVTHVYENVVGITPSTSELNLYKGYLENGAYTKAQLLTLAHSVDLIEDQVNISGLSQTGLEYII